MLVAIGSDHAGFRDEADILNLLKELGHECIDFVPMMRHSRLTTPIWRKGFQCGCLRKVERGILICGTGIGMSIVANKFPNVRAALCNELFSARMSRMHNDANILVVGGRIIAGPCQGNCAHLAYNAI